MPRGPTPQDRKAFGAGALASLRRAAFDVSWLLGRGYPPGATGKLVGDRYGLTRRQRQAVGRCSAAPEAVRRRRALRIAARAVCGRPLWVDGFNVLITVEAALSGGVLLRGRDGYLRDMASVHGTYRSSKVTGTAVAWIVGCIERLEPSELRVLLDAPVSNSGRLAEQVRTTAEGLPFPVKVEAVGDPDPILSRASPPVVVATADTAILDAGPQVFDLAGMAVARLARSGRIVPWIVDLGSVEGPGELGPGTVHARGNRGCPQNGDGEQGRARCPVAWTGRPSEDEGSSP